MPENNFFKQIEAQSPQENSSRPPLSLGTQEKGNLVFFDESKIFLELPKYLKQFDLTHDEVISFTDLFDHDVKRLHERQIREDANNPNQAQYNARKIALSKLEQQIEDYFEEKKNRGDERLIPYLISKQAAKQVIEKGKQSIQISKEGKQKVLVVVNLDLDGLKAINDTNNHEVGDFALKYFGAKLYDAVRPGVGANVIHYSGDEFGISLEMEFDDELNQEEVNEKIQKRINYIIEQASKVFEKKDNDSNIPEQENRRKEDAILRAFGKIHIENDAIRNSILQKFAASAPKITSSTGKQEVSSGFMVVRKEDDISFSEIQQKADFAANTSKLIPYLELLRKIKNNVNKQNVVSIPPEKRVLNFSDAKTKLAEYTTEEVEEATALRELNRGTQRLTPNVDTFDRLRVMYFMVKLSTKLNNLEPKQQDKLLKTIGTAGEQLDTL